MRHLQAAALAYFLLIPALACTSNQSDCSRNPNLECFVAKGFGDAGTGAGAATGGGGTGGMPECSMPSDCDGQAPTCKENICTGGKCGLANAAGGTPCGTNGVLACEGGECTGCVDPADCGTPTLCHKLECINATCGESLDVTLKCGPDGSGTCDLQGECAPCDDGLHNGSETDTDCGGSCPARCTRGQACTTKGDCDNQFDECVDGLCCNNACSGPCMACNNPGSPGICSPRSGNDPAGMCTGTQQCNLELACLKANGQSCVSSEQCASGLCDMNVCAACRPNIFCPSQLPCINGICASKGLPEGEICAAGEMCASGHCNDGVCCESACDGLCMSCRTPYTSQPEGTCGPIFAGYDPHDECSGPGNAATCSGQLDPMDTTQSTCGTN